MMLDLLMGGVNYLKLVDVGFCLLFLTWILWDVLNRRRDNGVERVTPLKPPLFIPRITMLLNFVISLCYLAFFLHEMLTIGVAAAAPIEAVFSAMAWFFACMVAVYAVSREQNRWPLVVMVWWGVASFYYFVEVVLCVLIHLNKYIDSPEFLTRSNLIDFAALPISLLLFINALRTNANETACDLAKPLLESDLGRECDPFSRAGIWSHVTFRWLNPLFAKGHLDKLQIKDIPPIPPTETADEASSLLQEFLIKPKSQGPSLPSAMFNAWRTPLALNAVFAGVYTVASYIGPLLITSFVNFLSTKDEKNTKWLHGLVLALIFFAAKTVESLCQRQWYFGARRIGIKVRAALMALTYKKSLAIKYGGTSSGKIINYINVDVERIGDFCWYFHGIWLLPMQVIFALVILYKNLGAAPSVAALFTTVFVMISNTPLANMQERLHTRIMEAKDSRIKATSETLKSMRVLKLHSWESTFFNRLLEFRETERGWLKKYLYTSSAVAFLFWASPTVVSVVTFTVCVVLGTPLTSATVLSALATFRILQEPIYNLPELLSMIAQTKVSIDRVKNFIMEEDQKRQRRSHSPNASATCVAVEIEPGEYAWQNRDAKKPTIKITEKLRIMKGSKVAICGSVGSGKTSLLCSIIGEIPRISGPSIKTHGSKAFVLQSAWIQTGTIRDNVLFGKEMDRAFYEEVVEACALNQDMETWADGDLCLVGERGMNLSGGQKQRIQMARALYSNSDIYLLDDPFSAVDAHTGAHMFKKCLIQLLHNKTVVYVTHQLEFLDASDLVLVMKDGRIVESGKYQDLILNHDGELVKQMEAHSTSLNQVNPPPLRRKATNLHPTKLVELTEIKFLDHSTGSMDSHSSKCEHQETESGRVKWEVYATFVTTAYKGALVPVILMCQILFQLLQMASNYWIAWGSEREDSVTKQDLIGIFAFLSGGSSIFILGRAVLLSTVAIATAQRLFLGMMSSIFRAPLSFFDSTPSSRILNRASTDQSVVDTDIPYRLAGLVFALIQLLSIIVLMSQVAWQVFFLFIVVFVVSIWYQAYYIRSARELARMVPAQQAPILHHFSESIGGATVIRSFNQEDRFCKKSFELIDHYSRVAFYNSASMEWLCARINFLFNLVFFLLLVILVSLPQAAIDSSLGGLAATYGLNLNVLQAWVIWNLCNVENKMISVERILQFTGIQSEAPLVIEDNRPDAEWPRVGTVEIENLQVHYNPLLPKVLKGITCTFPGKKKIGVVGRTGSGKSTLIQALFRVVEPSEGRIVIDGIDISKIGLQDLRCRLSIIPQDPILFQGTLRTNLDPLQEHSDQEIWEVLQKCHVAENVKQDERLLEAPVAEDGENWSVGQRQLMCLARVLLQRRRILVLDEATASVDSATDNLIQKTIREETNGCTVITVAHRIPTVVDNDLILLLSQGKVVEYDSPAQLLRDTNSAFSGLVMEFLRTSSANNSFE